MSTIAPQFVQAVKPGKLFIDGQWLESASGKSFEVFNPATAEVLTTVVDADEQDVDKAVRAARQAFDEGPWPRMSPRERGAVVERIGDLIAERKDELAELESLDVGKPISEARGDMALTVDTYHYYAGWADKLAGETNPVGGGYLNYTMREPVGVVGAILPWNFPFMLASWKVAPALVCGNTMVIKPAEQTPLSTLRLADICREAGVPDGVLNIITGFGNIAGAPLVRHPGVDKITFTGEYRTMQEIMRDAAPTLKRLTAELGGKSPNIVFADADLDAAVTGALLGIYLNQGQVCCAGSRLFVESSIHDEFLGRLVERSKTIRIGNPLDSDTEMGPLNSAEHMEKVLRLIGSGKRTARLLTGGERIEPGGLKGWFVEPTVFDRVNNTMEIACEEVFGPVLSVLPFSDEAHMVEQANDTIFGLAAAVWTRDIGRAHSLARAIRAGTIWINCYDRFDPCAPFGGYKYSGFGRENSVHALNSYTEVKSVWVKLS